MDDKSRQGFFCLVRGNKNKIHLLAYAGGEKNRKIRIDKIYIISNENNHFKFEKKIINLMYSLRSTAQTVEGSCSSHYKHPLLGIEHFPSNVLKEILGITWNLD